MTQFFIILVGDGTVSVKVDAAPLYSIINTQKIFEITNFPLNPFTYT